VRWALAALVAVSAAACSTTKQDSCAGLGCPSGSGTLTLQVLDTQTGAPVAGEVTFTAMGQPLHFMCSVFGDLGAACPSWTFSYEGTYDAVVQAAGYADGAIHFVLTGPAGCCGKGPDVSDTVKLTKL
jgi:hypothetical protein